MGTQVINPASVLNETQLLVVLLKRYKNLVGPRGRPI
jgi:hypothetical protein